MSTEPNQNSDIESNQNSDSPRRKILQPAVFKSVAIVAAIAGAWGVKEAQYGSDRNVISETPVPFSAAAKQTTDPITVSPLEQVVNKNYTTMLDGLDTMGETLNVLEHVQSEIDDINDDYWAERRAKAAAFETVANNHLTNRLLDEIPNYLPGINLDQAIDLTREEMATVNQLHDGIEYQESRIKSVIETTAVVFSDQLAKTHDDPTVIPGATRAVDSLSQNLIAEIHHDIVVTDFLDSVRSEIPAEILDANQANIDKAMETARKNMEQVNEYGRSITGTLTNKFIFENTAREFRDAIGNPDVDTDIVRKLFWIVERSLDVQAVSGEYHKEAFAGIITPGPSIDRELSDDVVEKMQAGQFIVDPFSKAEDHNEGTNLDDDDPSVP